MEVKLTIWERNIQLAFYSFVVVSIICTYNYIDFSSFSSLNADGTVEGKLPPIRVIPFQGWSWFTVCIVICQAFGGILVAATLKYADSIVRNFAVAGSIMLSTIFGHLYMGGILDLFVILGCLCTVLAVFNYTFDTTVMETPIVNAYKPVPSESSEK